MKYTPPPVPDKTSPLSVEQAEFLSGFRKTPNGRQTRLAEFYVADYCNRNYVFFIPTDNPNFNVLLESWINGRHVRIDADFEFSKCSHYHSCKNVRLVEVLTEKENEDWTVKKKSLFDTEWRRQCGKLKSHRKRGGKRIANDGDYEDE